jgi:hypothetical protein
MGDVNYGGCCLYSSLRIHGYRGLDSFRMEGLGRINLLVGTNNSGKTSILECIEFLRSAGNSYVFSSIVGRRGEWGYSTDENSPPSIDISHLFANHDLRGEVVIEADRADNASSHDWNEKVTVCVQHPRDDELGPKEHALLEDDEPLVLTVDWSNTEDNFKTGVTSEGLISLPRRLLQLRNGSAQGVQFIRSNGMTAPDTIRLFDDIVLTENEEHVTQALRIIEPTIERIASVGTERRLFFRDAPGGVFLKLSDVAQRIPIGSTGDGMWRMLGLALALANAKGGVLLVDQIDTGLHYSVMENMWRMVSERAAALTVQVFATTHSRDCYESLAAILQPGSLPSEVTIQRIDPSRGQAVRFSNDDIVAAAERGIEVR